MEIMHIWDQCGFAKNISRLNLGPSIRLSRLVRLPEYGVASRAVSAVRLPLSGAYMEYLKYEVKRNIKRNVIFETHTPFFFELFPEMVHRTIFHAHGSEIRITDSNGSTISQIDETTRFGLENSPLTLFSTPDLESPISEFSSSYKWVPHFAISRISKPVENSQIDLFFASSWNTWKGANQVLELLKQIQQRRRDLRAQGVLLGELAPDAAELGVELLPTMSRKSFNRKLAGAKVVIGQGFGIIGASELEAILMGVQFFPFKPDASWMQAYGFEDSDFMPNLELQERLGRQLDGNSKSESSYATKVLQTHSSQNIVAILNESYASLFK
jgi:hypothetical protein